MHPEQPCPDTAAELFDQPSTLGELFTSRERARILFEAGRRFGGTEHADRGVARRMLEGDFDAAQDLQQTLDLFGLTELADRIDLDDFPMSEDEWFASIRRQSGRDTTKTKTDIDAVRDGFRQLGGNP